MKTWITGGVIVAAAVLLAPTPLVAADLGGNCCADLEERIAELEATVARKGNRKVTLTISGQVSKALLWHDIDGLPGANKFRVIDNSNSGTRLRIAGEAKASQTLKVGFYVELGFDETAGNLLGIGGFVDDVSVRHSAAWIETAVGKLTIGKTSSATDGIVEVDLSAANIASLPMSIEPLWSYSGLPSLGFGFLNPVPFDGGRAEIVRYDTPVLAGFQGSAAWGGGQTLSGDDLWDVALRYVGEFGGVRIAGGVGYRVENLDTFAAPETKTLAGSASMMHSASGLFVTGAFGDQKDNPVFGDVQMWQLRGGLEKNITGIGATTLFVEYGDHKLKDIDFDSTFWGLGIVQQIDNAATDLFVSYRSYDIGGGFDAQVGMAGMRVKF